MLTLSDLQLAAQCAVFAVVFSDILTRERMILAAYGRWVERLAITRPGVAYPIGYCAKCTGGQVALWSFFIHAAESVAYHPATGICRVVCGVCAAILISAFLSAWYGRLIR